MKWSLRIGTVSGISVFIHWTFLILLGWVFFEHLGQGAGVGVALRGVGFVLALFGCVVLHEFGHALTARRYGIRTQDITLLPIGGVARLERMPDQPMQEFWVAIAGPAVNVVIAGVLFTIIALLAGLGGIFSVQLVAGDFLVALLWVNLLLIAFNLLPAFPMDGGRILRALLALRLGRGRATAIAARIGQVMAVGFVLTGLFLFDNPFLAFIGVFVFLGAKAEARAVALDSMIRRLRVRDAMRTRLRALSATDSLSAALGEFPTGAQADFPVLLANGQLAGILRGEDLYRAVADRGAGVSVAEVMCREFPVLEADTPLEAACLALRQSNWGTAPVLEHGRLVGLLSLETAAAPAATSPPHTAS